MELSSKIKGLKFMRKKEDSLLKKKENLELSQVVNNNIWKHKEQVGGGGMNSTTGTTIGRKKPKFTVEYDYSHKGRSSSSYLATKKEKETVL